MSMTVHFYRYQGHPNKVNKTFATTYSPKIINPTEAFDDQTPMLILSYDSTIYNNANYCIIDTGCYFIESRALETGQRMILNLKKDVLMSNRTELLQTDVIPLRVGNDINAFIHDDQDISATYKDVQNYYIGSLEFNGNSPVILAAMGSRSVI